MSKMDSGDNSVTTSVIVMQTTIDYLVATQQMDKLDQLIDGTVEKKTIWLNEDKDAMEQTGDEVTYYKQTTNE
jgi:hypothetical protein